MTGFIQFPKIDIMSFYLYFVNVGLHRATVYFPFLVCLVFQPIFFFFDLSPKAPIDNLMQSLGQETICRSKTNWDLGLGKSTLIHSKEFFSPYSLKTMTHS